MTLNPGQPERSVWRFRLLGGFEATRGTEPLAKLRSRSAQSLLAYLVLNAGKEYSRGELGSLFWPDSDGDRQHQNVRRSLSDVGQALEGDSLGTPVLISVRDRAGVLEEMTASDVQDFRALLRKASACDTPEKIALLRRAVECYEGPLLPMCPEYCFVPYRMELEESFARAVVLLCEALCRVDPMEATQVGRRAALYAPLREDVHIALIRSYASSGLSTEAVRQYEELERILDDQFGETPSIAATEALDGIPRGARAQKAVFVDPVTRSPQLERSGGSVPLGSLYYVERTADIDLYRFLAEREGVVLIKGPRQVGKTSLAARGVAWARSRGMQTAFCDFQTVSGSQLSESEDLYRLIGHRFAKDLGASYDVQSNWNGWLGPNDNLEQVVERVLAETEGRVLWALDEVDRLFGSPLANDFFGLLRGWYNRRAVEPDGPWHRLTLLITYATEAHLFISDVNQSPFNIGVRLDLDDFTVGQVAELDQRYGLPLNSADAVSRLHELTGGHPHLTRRAFDWLAEDKGDLVELDAIASSPAGPFADHLKRIGFMLSRDRASVTVVRDLLEEREPASPVLIEALVAGGLLRKVRAGATGFRSPIYRRWLEQHLPSVNDL